MSGSGKFSSGDGKRIQIRASEHVGAEPRPGQNNRSTGLGTASELPEGTGGRNHLFGADFRMESGNGVVKHNPSVISGCPSAKSLVRENRIRKSPRRNTLSSTGDSILLPA